MNKNQNICAFGMPKDIPSHLPVALSTSLLLYIPALHCLVTGWLVTFCLDCDVRTRWILTHHRYHGAVLLVL